MKALLCNDYRICPYREGQSRMDLAVELLRPSISDSTFEGSAGLMDFMNRQHFVCTKAINLHIKRR